MGTETGPITVSALETDKVDRVAALAEQAAATGQPFRFRVTVLVYDGNRQYVQWPGQSRAVAAPDFRTAQVVMDVIHTALDVVAELGAVKVAEALEALRPAPASEETQEPRR
jgi:hypothetical protein